MLRFLFSLSILLPILVSAQQHPFINYSTKDGLAQSQVRAIAQDEYGYIWFGTQAGLSRFDGYQFKNFSINEGLPNNQVNCLLPDSGGIWVGTTGSLAKFTLDGIQTIPLPDSLINSRIVELLIDDQDVMWIALENHGILKFDGDQFQHIGLKEGLQNNFVRAISKSPYGDIWIGTREGVAVYKDDKITVLNQELLSQSSISDIFFTQNGKVIISSFGDGFFVGEETGFTNFTMGDGSHSNHIRSAVETLDGRICLIARQGFAFFDGKEFDIFTEEQGLPYLSIKSVFVDREGNLWLGTDGQGVLFRAGTSFTTITMADGAHSDLILSIAAIDSTRLFLGSYDNGITIYDEQSFHPYPYADSLRNQTIWSLLYDENKVLWAGTSNGLMREENGQITYLDRDAGIPGIRITAISESQGTVWVGAESGLAQLSGSGQLLQSFEEITGFEGRRIRSILPRDTADIWVGAENGLFHITDTSIDKHVTPGKIPPPIYCLAADDYHQLWVGTSNGLYVTYRDSIGFIEVELGKNYSSKNINFLNILPDTTLAIGTNNGLYRIKLKPGMPGSEVKATHYTQYEGLEAEETNQNSSLFQGSSLWFGSTLGTIKFDLNQDKVRNAKAPLLNITGLQLFLEETPWREIADSISPSTGLPVDLSLDYQSNYLTFDFAGISLSNPEKVSYRYTLEGADENWLGPTKNRSATYAYLPHGNYTFRIEAFSEDNPEVKSETAFAFSITPPFYLTPWFFTLSGIAVIALLLTIYQNQIKKEEEKRANLQLKFQSRLMELESQSLNSSMNRHFIFNSLNSIQYYINMQDRKSANRYLTSFAKLIRKNLDSSQQNETSLQDELERLKLYLSLEQMRFQGRFDYQIEVDENVQTEDVNIPAMMLQPFLENSIWHGILPNDKHGELKLRILDRVEEIEIHIEDNGIGVETSKQQKIDTGNGHISQGMDITQSRLQLYKNMTGLNYTIEGPFEMKGLDQETIGTKVILFIPRNFGISRA